MSTLNVLCTVAVLAASLTAQQTPPAPQGPKPAVPAPVVGPAPPPQVQKFQPGGGNDWFERTREDLGTFFEREVAIGRFKFANPRETTHRISGLQPNCACAKAIVRVGDRRYEIGSDRVLYRVRDDAEKGTVKEKVAHITVAPEEDGEVEVHMNMAGIKGPKQATLVLRIDDPKLPMVNLHWQAVGATYFVVEPESVHLNEMSWKDKREFEFKIYSPLKPDFNIVGHDELPEAMTVAYEKVEENGRTVWKVKGTYGPGANERQQGGLIRLRTDADGRYAEARVTAFVRGPLTVKPGGFVSLGLIRRGQGKRVEVTITPTDKFDLEVEKIEVARLNGVKDDQRKFLKFEHHKEGDDVKVVIAVDEHMAPTYLNGLLKIHLNHPALGLKEVMFNGIVR